MFSPLSIDLTNTYGLSASSKVFASILERYQKHGCKFLHKSADGALSQIQMAHCHTTDVFCICKFYPE